MADVLVLGSGVIGLTAALRLQEGGLRVAIWTAARWPESVSSVAAAIWYPYRANPAARVEAWARETFEVYREIARDPAAGVRMRTGRVFWRDESDDPRLECIPSPARELAPGEIASGYRFGAEVEVPVVEMPLFLPLLEERFIRGGGSIELRAVRSLAEAVAGCPRVINCTGLGAGKVAGDPTVVPIRGQFVRVENPGPERFALEAGEHEREVTYVIPRSRDVVLGGTAEEGEWSREPDPAAARAIVERCAAMEPRLRGARILEHRMGLRPGRPAVRLERDPLEPRVIHNYGHGSSGVTVAWGCADAVAALIRQSGEDRGPA